jgi:PKD repeat protein
LRAVAGLSAVLVLLGLSGTSSGQNLVIAPTTTLAAETGNNTSTADAFAGQPGGNLPAGNVSKAPISSALYPGSNTRIYAHFMGWFGGTNHKNVGYQSDDPGQVRRQVDDMMSRGIQGAILDWYGPNNSRPNQTTIYLMREAELRGGAFEFAVMEDGGALSPCAATTGCDVTSQLISDLTYAYSNFENSTAYMRVNGRPVVFFFGTEAFAIDWARAKSSVPGNPLFIFRNSGAFTTALSDGAFGWVEPTSDPLNMGFPYLDDFYHVGATFPQQLAFGSTYKGFNDSIAAWAPTPPRVLSQQCGATWLATFAEIGKYYSTNNQLPALQLVTWNDYEEGTEIESGIDNCVSAAASVSGSTLNWSITGSETTLDHYTVFISTDGSNLMPIGDQPASARSLDLAPLHIPSGNYSVLVKAIGKPTLRNQMSAAVAFSIANQPPVAALSVTPTSGTSPVTVTASTAGSSDAGGSIASSAIDFGDGATASGPTATHTYTVAGTYTVRGTITDNLGATAAVTASVTVDAAPSGSGDVTLGAAPSLMTVNRGQAGVFNVSVAPTSGSFTATVKLTCQNLPRQASCSFSPASVVPGNATATATLTLGTATTAASVRPLNAPVFAFWMGGSPALGMMGLVFAGRGKRNWRIGNRVLWLGIVLLLALMAMGCGAVVHSTQTAQDAYKAGASGTPTGQYNIIIVATSGSLQHSTTVTLVVQ